MAKKTNGESVNYFRIIGSGYLLILAVQLFSRADTAENPAFGLICAVLFVIVGVMMLVLEWKHYRNTNGKRSTLQEGHLLEEKDTKEEG